MHLWHMIAPRKGLRAWPSFLPIVSTATTAPQGNCGTVAPWVGMVAVWLLVRRRQQFTSTRTKVAAQKSRGNYCTNSCTSARCRECFHDCLHRPVAGLPPNQHSAHQLLVLLMGVLNEQTHSRHTSDMCNDTYPCNNITRCHRSARSISRCVSSRAPVSGPMVIQVALQVVLSSNCSSSQ